MTLPTAQQRDAAAPALPAGPKSLIAKLDGWTHTVTQAFGPCEFGALSEETDGDGHHKQIEVVEDVDSVCLRARHPDGRAFVALWVHRPSKGTWTLDTAFRARHHGEPSPVPLKATPLTAYVTADGPPPDPAVAEQLARDLAELAEHRARWEANQDVWVPIPQTWASLGAGDVFLDARGAPWSLVAVTPAPGGVLVRARHGAQEYAGRPGAPTALVLVPVPERDALTLSRAVLGSRIMERKTA
jgi:hypothetical protein